MSSEEKKNYRRVVVINLLDALEKVAVRMN